MKIIDENKIYHALNNIRLIQKMENHLEFIKVELLQRRPHKDYKTIKNDKLHNFLIEEEVLAWRTILEGVEIEEKDQIPLKKGSMF